MQTQIIDGRKIKDEIIKEIKEGVLSLPFTPIFCDILVGSDPVSASYVRIKSKIAALAEIKFRTVEFKDQATTEEIIEEIENLNRVPHMCGIIIQLPLPGHIDKRTVLDAIKPSLDVDCLGTINSESFYKNDGEIGYPTALACMRILDSLNLDLTNKKILVLGQGSLVGLPVTHLLRSKGLEVETADIKTTNTEELIKNADVIISAIGRAKYIKDYMIKKDVILIDAGTSEDNGAVVGDVDLDSVMNIASFVSPTPGGVGPVTVAMLLQNVLQVAKDKISN
ncbi:MAG: bifunctional 5,10-methylenetetrahydrofolate dehydrogenase/5,10-methenyltetrahydrofolate cyclohydrolase [Candidatus Pacebacteria bacterium]|nr:bifunctional 5,10-methylenetetrahydrofolate dehydrogenase/5,10-methenyltetrahydrofolate cyclohydrolase [Candidatus Paceibacterota bacterium]